MSARDTKKADNFDEDLRRLAEPPDEAIDTSDAPEIEHWSQAERGKFYMMGAELHIPMYFDYKVQQFLTIRSRAKGMELNNLAGIR